jgi:hypothetical protein
MTFLSFFSHRSQEKRETGARPKTRSRKKTQGPAAGYAAAGCFSVLLPERLSACAPCTFGTRSQAGFSRKPSFRSPFILRVLLLRQGLSLLSCEIHTAGIKLLSHSKTHCPYCKDFFEANLKISLFTQFYRAAYGIFNAKFTKSDFSLPFICDKILRRF